MGECCLWHGGHAIAKARHTPPAPIETETAAGRLQAAVLDLAEDVRRLTDLVEQLRADNSRLMNTGVAAASEGGDESVADSTAM